MDIPVELSAVLAADPPKDATVVQEFYGVFNDAEFLEPRFASGEIHPMLRDKILDEPLFTSPVAGAAKRFMLWTNDQRAIHGNFLKEGWAVLQKQTVTTTPWTKVEGQELDDIDEGRKPNG